MGPTVEIRCPKTMVIYAAVAELSQEVTVLSLFWAPRSGED